MSRFHEKQAAKLERFKQYAENAQERAGLRFETAHRMAACIPMGQPILVGHHSERADRRFRARIDDNVRKGFKEEGKAKHWERRVESIQSSRAIFSDDPDAMDKLGAKVERLEAWRDEIKRISAEYRKHGDLSQIEMSDLVRQKCLENMRIWGGGPFPAYVLSNLGAKIRTAKQRSEAISRAESFEPFEVNGVRVALNDGQIQVVFPYKPDEATRSKLKRSPIALKWSGYSKAWVRKYTGQGLYFTQALKAALDESRAES